MLVKKRQQGLMTLFALIALIGAACGGSSGSSSSSASTCSGGQKGLWGSNYCGKPNGSPIKVGIATDVAGKAGALGPTAIQGFKMMVDDVNKNGGIMGHSVEFVVRDDQLDPSMDETQFRQLVLSDRVKATFGPLLSSGLIAQSKVNAAYKMPLISAMAADDRVVNNAVDGSWNKYLGLVSPSTQVEACSSAKFVATKLPQYTRIAVMKMNYDFGIDNAREFEQCVTKDNPNVQIVKDVAAPLGSKDWTPFINVMLSAKPQFIYTNAFGGDALSFLKQYNQLGLTLPWMALWDTASLAQLGNNLPAAASYAYMRGPFFAAPQDSAKPFIDEFKSRYGTYPADWALMAMEDFISYKKAVETAGSFDGDPVMKAFHKENFSGPFGNIQIRCINGQGDVPVWVGKLTSDSQYGFASLNPFQEFRSHEVWPSDQELKIPNQGQCS